MQCGDGKIAFNDGEITIEFAPPIDNPHLAQYFKDLGYVSRPKDNIVEKIKVPTNDGDVNNPNSHETGERYEIIFLEAESHTGIRNRTRRRERERKR